MLSVDEIKEMNSIIDGKWNKLYEKKNKICIENVLSESSSVKIIFEDVDRNDLWSCVIKIRNFNEKIEEEFFVSGFSDVSDVEITGNKWCYLGYIMFYCPS